MVDIGKSVGQVRGADSELTLEVPSFADRCVAGELDRGSKGLGAGRLVARLEGGFSIRGPEVVQMRISGASSSPTQNPAES